MMTIISFYTGTLLHNILIIDDQKLQYIPVDPWLTQNVQNLSCKQTKSV